MTSHAEKKRRHRHKRAASSGAARAGQVSDLGPYVAFALVLLFAAFIFYITLPEVWLTLSAGLLAGWFVYVMIETLRGYQGQSLYRWQKGLVRLPLMLSGAAAMPVSEMPGTAKGRLAIVMALVLMLAAAALFAWTII